MVELEINCKKCDHKESEHHVDSFGSWYCTSCNCKQLKTKKIEKYDAIVEDEYLGIVPLVHRGKKYVEIEFVKKRDAAKREQLIKAVNRCLFPHIYDKERPNGYHNRISCLESIRDEIEEVLADEVDEGTSSLLGSGTEHKGEGQ